MAYAHAVGATRHTWESLRDLLARAMPVLKVRAANLNELADGARFLFAVRPLAMDEAAEQLLAGDAPARRRMTSTGVRTTPSTNINSSAAVSSRSRAGRRRSVEAMPPA